MNITKLPSGNYRIRYSVNGERKAFTIEHKPTKTEALRLISERSNISKPKYTFRNACEAYIDVKSNSLSPSTIRGYRGLLKQISAPLLDTKLESVTLHMIQFELVTLFYFCDRLYPIVDTPRSVPRSALIITIDSEICSPYGMSHTGKKARTKTASAGSAIMAMYFRIL